MKSYNIFASALLSVILFSCILLSSGCDNDTMWDSVNKPSEEKVLLSLVLLQSLNKYTVGGSVTGLTTPGLVLQNNSGDNLTINFSGPFQFATALSSGASYSATILNNTSGLTCNLANESGTIGNNNITNITITCF